MHNVHGRYDVDCLPSAAFELAQAADSGELIFAQAAGHTAMEPATTALVAHGKCKTYFSCIERLVANFQPFMCLDFSHCATRASTSRLLPRSSNSSSTGNPKRSEY